MMRMWSCEDRDAPFVEVFRRTAARAGYDLRIIAPGAEPEGFSQLRRHYRHLSPNPERFELASFRRWFEIADAVAPGDRFVLADSDLVVQTPFADLPAEFREADALVGSIGATDDVPEEGINGGFSIWTGALLRRFCAYMVAQYETDREGLEALHVARVAAGNPRASISDMTLLYRWVQAEGIAFVNSNRIVEGQYIDHNFFMPGCLHGRFRMAYGRKALHFRPDGFWLETLKGEPVRPAALHLGGRYKILAEAIESGDVAALAAKSLYILGGRAGRSLLGKLGIQA